MKHLFVLLVFLVGCTAAQKDWRNNLYVDISAGGDISPHGEVDPATTITSTGINYPLIWNIWWTVGGWKGFDDGWGFYWGVTYAWAPFAGKESNGYQKAN